MTLKLKQKEGKEQGGIKEEIHLPLLEVITDHKALFWEGRKRQ